MNENDHKQTVFNMPWSSSAAHIVRPKHLFCESLSRNAVSSSVFLEYVAAVNNLTDLASKTEHTAQRYWDKTKKGPANAGPSKESSIRPLGLFECFLEFC